MSRSVADVDSFITLLRVACEDRKINAQLERILALPDDERKGFVHTWVTDLIIAGAPAGFIEAIGCLMDDQVAEKTYEVIFQCSRERRA